MKHLKIIEWAMINGRRVGPHDGVISVTDDQAQSLIDSKQAIDVTGDFPDAETVVAGAAPIAAVPKKASKAAATDAPAPVATPSINGVEDATQKDA